MKKRIRVTYSVPINYNNFGMPVYDEELNRSVGYFEFWGTFPYFYYEDEVLKTCPITLGIIIDKKSGKCHKIHPQDIIFIVNTNN